jgi:tetratricopeptide (TPR) repeat protein
VTQSRRLPLALLLLLLAGGCQTDREGVQVNLTAAARAYRQRLEARSRGANVQHIIAHLSATQLNDLGVLYEREGRLDDAAWAYRQAIRRDLRLARAYVNLGNVLRRQGKHDEALHRYRQAMAADPADFAAANNFADLCAEQRIRLPEAIALLRPRLSEAGLHRPYGLDTLGRLYHLRGDHAGAVDALAAALRAADPDDLSLRAAIHEHLEAVHRDAGRSAEAARHGSEARRLRERMSGRSAPELPHPNAKGGETTPDDRS